MNTILDHQDTANTNATHSRTNLGNAPVYIDVRTPLEFETVHIPEARNIPLPELHRYLGELKTLSEDHTLMLVCRTQNRVKIAYDYLTNNGLTNCDILEGGITAWIAQDKPVIRGPQRLSLEGQVRAIAGGLILLGVATGFLVHNGFFFLPVLVGAGLLHAGLTDSCLMGLVLAKLPMNTTGNTPSSIEKKGGRP